MRIFGRVRQRPSTDWRLATNRAFTLIDDGRYEDAGALLTRAADLEPWLSESWFNLALLHKFRHDWEQARSAGLRAVALLERDTGAPDWWNVGIAATALQDWPLARRAWQAYGLAVPGAGTVADEPLGMDLGGAAVRLSPEGEAEVVWGRRLDPARIEIQNIPCLLYTS
ncbi:tetratricopeptide repeat protein, partial [Streptomyces sp. NPDC059853]|uniref:tetratricopeptide repeat protein n=1 Tax=Streptomyces sp. NPDC059853 TaxID=3346973 RepID=UPI00365551A9